MFKYILAEGENINWMALFALLTFFCMFLVSVVTVFGNKNKLYKHMAELPLDLKNDEKKLTMTKNNPVYIVSFFAISVPTLLTAAEIPNPVQASTHVVPYTFLGIGAAVIVGALWMLFKLYSTIIFVEKVRLLKKYSPEVLEKASIKIETEPFWKKWYEKAIDLAPLEKEQEIMLDHDYDGIQELDNNLPPWWIALFYITIAISPVYIWYNHYSDYAKSQDEIYEIEVANAEKAVRTYLATQANVVDENSVIVLSEANEIALGKSMFDINCAACHGVNGEGTVGPNLTDPYWLHGGGIKDIFSTIKYGVPEKGMISWKAQLRASDMQKIASYILTLKDTNPPNAKEAQGDIWIAEEKDKELGMN